jgi:carotenoid cleavage dioxygenase-like enzyme
VQTERWKNERAARRSLHGLYRNPYTDDPSVRGKGRGAANTTPVFHGGKLIATKEDSRGWELDPRTLKTIGEVSYDGRLRSETMTAHPRIDPETGELHFFGYEAGGLATADVAYCVANKDGELVSENWLKMPYCALMHDFAVTEDYVIFPCFPITANLERIKGGGPHWAWDPSLQTMIGIMPRGGKAEQMRWFRGPACSVFHILNSFSEGSKVHMDLSVANVPAFEFIRQATNMNIPQYQVQSEVARWTFDMSKPGDEFQRQTIGPPGDLPRVAAKYNTRKYDVAYYGTYNPEFGPPILSGPVGAGFNALIRLEVESGRVKGLPMQPQWTVQEPVHIPSSKPGHEGYLAYVVDRHDLNVAEVHIAEAANLEKGAFVQIKVPMRLRSAVHGTWVPDNEMT